MLIKILDLAESTIGNTEYYPTLFKRIIWQVGCLFVINNKLCCADNLDFELVTKAGNR